MYFSRYNGNRSKTYVAIILAICALGLRANTVDAGEPILIHPDGQRVHVDQSRYAKDGNVLFMNIAKNNWRDVLRQAKLGGFDIVLSTLFDYGDWRTPFQFQHRGRPALQPFEDAAEMKRAIDAFHAEGILVACHGFWNVLTQHGGTSIVNFADPPADWCDIIIAIPVGRLTSDISEIDQELQLDSNVKSNSQWQHIVVENKGVPQIRTPWAYPTYAIGKEIVNATPDRIDGRTMRVYRGTERTTKRSHAAGTMVYLLPNRAGFFFKPDSPFQAASVTNFERTCRELNLSWFYVDGASGPNQIGEDWGRTIDNDWKRYRACYFENVDGLISLGGGIGPSVAPRVRWQALGDALWLYSKWKGDIDKWLNDFHQIASRRPRNAPYKYRAAWLPLDGNCDEAFIRRIYGDPVLGPTPKTFQEIPRHGDRPGWDENPRKDEVLTLIRELSSR